MTSSRLFLLCSSLLLSSLIAEAQTPAAPASASAKPEAAQANADAQALVSRVIAAAGGEAKLLRIFRMGERFNFGSEAKPADQQSKRSSIVQPPNSWWINDKERADPEPAKQDVYAWTLLALIDPKAKVEAIADLTDEGQALAGLRVSGSVEPAMELYFSKADHHLTRIDWRADVYRFSDWRVADGSGYAARTVIYKKAGMKPWFFHEITSLERLAVLPAGLEPKP